MMSITSTFSKNVKRATGVVGLFSIGLGLVQIVAPRKVCKLTGSTVTPGVMRGLGVREIASGLAVAGNPMLGLWSRLAGDVVDYTLLQRNGKGDTEESRAKIASFVVIGAGVVDAVCALKESRDALQGQRYQKSVIINKPIEEVFKFVRDFRNYPALIPELVAVEKVDEEKYRWTLRGMKRVEVEFEFKITEEKTNELISWQSEKKAGFLYSGSAHFQPEGRGRGTRLTIRAWYRTPAGRATGWLATVMGYAPEQIDADGLLRIKQKLEAGEIATTAGQPSGRKGAGQKRGGAIRDPSSKYDKLGRIIEPYALKSHNIEELEGRK